MQECAAVVRGHLQKVLWEPDSGDGSEVYKVFGKEQEIEQSEEKSIQTLRVTPYAFSLTKISI